MDINDELKKIDIKNCVLLFRWHDNKSNENILIYNSL